MKSIRILVTVLAIALLSVLTSQVVFTMKAKATSSYSIDDDKKKDGDKTKKSECCNQEAKDKGDCKKDDNCCKDKNKESCCKQGSSKDCPTTTTTKTDGCCKPKDLRE